MNETESVLDVQDAAREIFREDRPFSEVVTAVQDRFPRFPHDLIVDIVIEVYEHHIDERIFGAIQ